MRIEWFLWLASLVFSRRGVLAVQHLFVNVTDAAIPEGITVGAYYYPWYADDFHRGDGYVRKYLEPPQQPTLGEYNDRSAAVISQHLHWSRQANIGVWLCSWWGPKSREDETISQHILNHTELGDHKIAILYESINRVKDSGGYNPYVKVKEDLEHICTTYFDHPNYYTINGLPVVVMYLARVLDDLEGDDGLTILGETVNIMRTAVEDRCNTHIYIVGDQVWGKAPSMGTYYDSFNYLDAVANYDVYGNAGGAPYAGIGTVEAYYAEQANWLEFANANGVNYIPTVSPGYNDRGVRLANDHVALSRRLTPSDQPGSLFVSQLIRARHLIDPGADNLLLVNSFNEWHEDTQIEPVSGNISSQPVLYTNGVEYDGYGELYLNILRVATCGNMCLYSTSTPRATNLTDDDFVDKGSTTDSLVAAIYRPRQGNGFGVGTGFLRGELGSQSPELGLYDSTDPVVIKEHVTYSKKANIGVWVTSFDGRYQAADKITRLHIIPQLEEIQLAILYESEMRIMENDGYALERLEKDIIFMCRKYFRKSQYLVIGGKPVIFLRHAKVWNDVGRLEAIVDKMRTTALIEGFELYIVADHSSGSPGSTDESLLPFHILDAVTTVDVHSNLDTTGFVGFDGIDEYYDLQQNWRDLAGSMNCSFIPSVTVGFNSRPSVPGIAPVSRKIDQNSAEGSLFFESLQRALQQVDSKAKNIVLINSFNDWESDTQVEPVVGSPQSSPVSLTDGLEYEAYGHLYLDLLMNATKNGGSPSTGAVGDVLQFYPLQCNVEADLSTQVCESWSSLLGTANTHNKEVVVPCGKCVEMDVMVSKLFLLGGLDIQGKLLIPNGYNISLETPYVRVQGELEIQSNSIVTGSKPVELIMVDGDANIENFYGASSNQHACGSSQCAPGPKSIVVAGGKLNIHGIPEDMPTWVPLVDIVTSPGLGSGACSGFNIVSNGSTGNAMNEKIFSPTLGASMASEGEIVRIQGRTSSYHGIQIDLTSYISCISATDTYVVSLEVRPLRGGFNDSLTECSTTAENCFSIHAESMDAQYTTQSAKLYEIPPSPFYYGSWARVEEYLSFDASLVNDSNVFLALRLGGVEPEANFEIRDFSLSLAPEDACSRNSCSDLIPCNGDASLGIAFSPFHQRGGAEVGIHIEDGNPFWQIKRDDGESADDGFGWKISRSCLEEHAIFEFKMRVRVHSAVPIETAVYLQAALDATVNTQRVVVCPSSAGEWVSCIGYFEVPSDLLIGNQEFISGFLVTEGTSTTSYDVDDLSFKFVRMDGPVSKLVVSNRVEGKWGVGASILVTSHTLQWSEQNVRTIVSIESVNETLVSLGLNESIPVPATGLSSDFPVEVALLSRNVEFVGGSTLAVYHTPDVDQSIVGVDFVSFGRTSSGRLPIEFLHLGNTSGVVAKNSIRHSENGCIALIGSPNAAMVENVAYDTSGHCYIVEDGNHVKGNIGALTRSNDDTQIPATFSVQGTVNMVDNIAAGSQGVGFSILGQEELGIFDGNIAHSNNINGAVVSSVSGLGIGLLNRLSVYRNAGPGLVLSSVNHVEVRNGTFLDNRGNIEIEGSAEIVVSDTRFVGMSNEQLILESSSQSTISLCPNRREVLTGVQWSLMGSNREASRLQIERSSFLGFSDVKICKEYAMEVEPDAMGSNFSVVLDQLSMDEGTTGLNLCSAFRNNVRDVHVLDKSSSLSPAMAEGASASSIVIQGAKVLSFLDTSSCVYDSLSCYYYCAGTCLRTVSLSVDPSLANKPSFVVCRRDDDSVCETYEGRKVYEHKEIGGTTLASVISWLYEVTLPVGLYRGDFVDSATNKRTWPTFVSTSYSISDCENSLDTRSLWIPPPPTTDGKCLELIDDDQWVSGYGGLVPTSPPLCSNNATNDHGLAFGQYLDTRCLIEAASYQVTASADCGSTCQFGIVFNSDVRDTWTHSLDSVSHNVFSLSQVITTGTIKEWHGVFEVSADMAEASSALFYVGSNATASPFCVYNVTLSLVG
eukprot:Nitzschia sp. Nitz4//scaffold237_size30108//23491//29702//NITZ4_007996-RA/size30108-augustus-gene-0.41-mRNA-1//-1//CDS//3329543518//3884//frame0